MRDALTLIQISDTHLYDDPEKKLYGVNPVKGLQRVVHHAIQYKQPDSLFYTGDITHDGAAPAFQHFIALNQTVECPIHVIAGNHDQADLMRQHLNKPPFTQQKSIITEHWHILLLHSQQPDAVAGLISSDELQWLDRQLAASQKPTLIFTHHHPINIGTAWLDRIGILNGDELMSTLAKHKHVKAIAFGHIHQAFDHEQQQIRILGCPSSCAQFKPGSEEFAIDDIDPGYRVFQLLDNGELVTEVRRVGRQIEKIISGGQSGVDRAALDTAIQFGIDHGGWCPRDRKAIDGKIDRYYQLMETPSAAYTQRTEWNVRDSDATLVISRGKPTGGTALTVQLAKQMQKPLWLADVSDAADAAAIRTWLTQQQIRCLNIAGPRDDAQGRIYSDTLSWLRALFLQL